VGSAKCRLDDKMYTATCLSGAGNVAGIDEQRSSTGTLESHRLPTGDGDAICHQDGAFLTAIVGRTSKTKKSINYLGSSGSLSLSSTPLPLACPSDSCILISFTLFLTSFRLSSPRSRASLRAWLRLDAAARCRCSNLFGSMKTPGITPAASVCSPERKEQSSATNMFQELTNSPTIIINLSFHLSSGLAAHSCPGCIYSARRE
jgi:hypothetical protein